MKKETIAYVYYYNKIKASIASVVKIVSHNFL